jgi:glycosyltransferase involved in cell wall biosynthesis/2-polyprenyl-3-methyl-5-hydroxy-6-metoxy-1,4-benzoquinol methylase
MSERVKSCWCGNTSLEGFSADYSHCGVCESLISVKPLDQSDPRVMDDERDFYGRGYWFEHQTRDLGFPDLMNRARTDLAERCLHWLRVLLKYKLPPAAAIEIGSAHGGFVGMLRWAGFDATGLELSPWVVNYARQTFGVPVLLGPLEDQEIAPASLDVIALMDVLEHLPDPEGTLRRCLTLLKLSGILILQTPRYPEGKTYDELAAEGDPFLEQLKANEHAYLFSGRSIRQFLERLGVEYLVFEPAMFAHYDMFLVASRAPLTARSCEEIESALNATPTGRVVRAMLDLDDQNERLKDRLSGSEVDRAARLRVIQEQSRKIEEVGAERNTLRAEGMELRRRLDDADMDRAQRLRVIEEQGRKIEEIEGALGYQLAKLRREFEAAEADRAARLENMIRLEALLRESEADRAARLENMIRLEALLKESEACRAAQSEDIQRLEGSLKGLETERARDLGAIQQIREKLDRSEQERTRIQRECDRLRRELGESQEDRGRLWAAHETLDKDLAAMRARCDRVEQGLDYDRRRWEILTPALQALRRSRAYRLMRAVRRWRWLEDVLAQTVPGEPDQSRRRDEGAAGSNALKRVAVDLTPVQPGGENGGAKIVAKGLVKHLSELAPQCEWVLLTSERNHEELADLDAHNVRRLCVIHEGGAAPDPCNWRMRAEAWARRTLGGALPLPAKRWLRALAGSAFDRPPTSRLPSRIGAGLVFCPFTAPHFFEPLVPMVIVVHDLQYLSYPQFFSDRERYERDKDFRQSARLAAKLVCVSEYVRKTVLEHSEVAPDRVAAIHTRLCRRLHRTQDDASGMLARLGVQSGRFLVYPANFWLHKNHEMLLTAWGLYRAQHPESDLKLVCTGVPGERMAALVWAAQRMGLDADVVFAGYLPDDEFAALLETCCAVIFPSLYEGFGLPVLEAMASGKPVLCSHATSLPEIAGDAALFFDPRKPQDIAGAVERIENDTELARQLVKRGREQANTFGDSAEMARQYWRVLGEAFDDRSQSGIFLEGVYSDGWTGERLTISHGSSAVDRHLELRIFAPPRLPFERVSLALRESRKGRPVIHTIERGRELTIRHALSHEDRFVEVEITPAFQPKAHNMGEDLRTLGCRCRSCQVVSPDGTIVLWKEQGVDGTSH